MNKEIQEAFRHQKEGRVFLAKKDFKQAVHEFRAGLADLAKASRPERTDVIDDTGQKLTLASHKQDKGDFEHAANILNGVLESRLEMAVPVSRQKALEIARVDAEKQHRDWSKYEVSAILERDGWHIAYLSKDSQRGGGGPEYVIDVNTGKIVSKHYAR